MKEMTKDDVEVVKHYLDKAFHAVGHAAEAASVAFDVRCENQIDAAIEALTKAKGRLNDWPTLMPPKKRWELYKDCHEAEAARAAEKVIMSVTWAFVSWLYMDVIEGESRLDYLRRCEELRILKQDGYREMKKLEKEAKKEGGAK